MRTSHRNHAPGRLAVTLVALVSVALLAAAANADVVNGDFENGGADWTAVGPPDWPISFPDQGGNPDGYASIESPLGNQGGRACIEQTFMCGDPDEGTECTIGFDVRLDPIDALPGSARIVVVIDGVEDVVTTGATDWTTVTYVVPCGEHTIQLCLDVDPQNNMWQACFDNVRAECTGGVPGEGQTWTNLKGLFR